MLVLQVVVDAIDPSVIVSQCASKTFDFGSVTEPELTNFTIPLQLQAGTLRIVLLTYYSASSQMIYATVGLQVRHADSMPSSVLYGKSRRRSSACVIPHLVSFAVNCGISDLH